MAKAPGQSHRKGMTFVQTVEMFDDEETSRKWFEEQHWPDGPFCPHCGSFNVQSGIKHHSMTHRCRDCFDKRKFSVRVGTILENSRLPYRTWAIGIYLFTTNLKGISSMKLYRELGITQKTAWFMLHRLRAAMEANNPLFQGPVEADETFVGGKEGNKHARKKLKAGRGTVGKTAVAGVKDRPTRQVVARVVENTDKTTLQGFVNDHAAEGATLYTDEASAYNGIERPHEAVNHSVGEYVREQAHTDGLESFWAPMKRGYVGVYHKMSPKHLQRYVDEFLHRHNNRPKDTIDQMAVVVRGMAGKILPYKKLIEDNGMKTGARPCARPDPDFQTELQHLALAAVGA